MTRIIGIAGSLRAGSYNAGLLRAAAAVMPEGAVLEIGSIRGIPLYDGDVDAREGAPPEVRTLKDLIAGADGLLIASPEYNNSMPGVLKNAIDWLSRPASDSARVFGGKPVATMGASPGGFGTILAQQAWLPVLRALGTRPWWGKQMLVSRAGNAFDANGNLTDEQVRTQLQQYLAGFVEYVQRG